MDRDRWQDVKKIFEGALERDPSRRFEYVAAECGDDAELLREVSSLLRSLDDADDFMEQPAVREVPEEIVAVRAGEYSNGQTVAQYRILCELGTGGQGVVYKALDTKLDRIVALKLLLPDLAFVDDTSGGRFRREVRSASVLDQPNIRMNAERLRRFMQEAKSASSLNHPHIITIHDVGEDSAVHYIAMELIDGETLRKKIESGSELRALVGWLAQAADGVAKAHAANIVHRDLKPENIMITRDGFAKVLDFGLAKLVVRDRSHVSRDLTREGTIVGTLAYMSPEQLRGKTVDARSDIFAFGCMLYEAATRRRPFSADTQVDLMHKIVHDKPQPIEEINRNVPADLRRIIRRCLAKDPDQRYQSMKDLGISLRELFEDWDQRSLQSDPGETPTLILEKPRAKKSWWWIPAAIGLVAVAIGGVLWWRATRTPNFTLDKIQISNLTTSGNIVTSVLSPDGRYLSYAAYDHDTYSLWLKQIATGSAVQIVPPSKLRLAHVAFSPESDYVWFTQRARPGVSLANLFRIPVLGGSMTKIAGDVDTEPGFSPNAREFAFVRRDSTAEESQLVIAEVNGGAERIVAKDKYETGFDLASPAWSPDGKHLVAAIGGRGGSEHEQLFLIDPRSGARTPIGTTTWRKLASFVWLPQSNGLLVVGDPDRATAPSKLWFVSAHDGKVTRVYADANDHWSISVTHDGRSVALSQRVYTGAVFSCDLNGENLKQISSPELVVRVGDLAPNGIAFAAERDGERSLWVIDESGTPHQVPNAVNPEHPTISNDGGTLLYQSKVNGPPHVFTIQADGSNLRQLTNGPNDSIGGISPDAKTFVYVNEQGNIVERPLNGNGSRVIAGNGSTFAGYSMDGKLIGVSRFLRENGRIVERRGELLDVHTGATVAATPLRGIPGWAPNGKFALLLDNNLFIDNRQITHFASGRTYDFGLTPDEKHYIVVRGDERNDVVMLTNFR